MASIEVDYKKIYDQTGSIGAPNTILGQADALNKQIINAYNNMTNMHAVWFGIRYNELATAFNNMIPEITTVLNYVVRDLPHNLKLIANNYSQADRGMNCGAADVVSPKTIPEIPTPADVGMRYQAEQVTEVKTMIENCFNNAVTAMQNIESLFNAVYWESEAAASFKSGLASNRSTIVNSFETIKQTFATKMAEAAADIQKAETSSNVNG